MFSLTHVGKSSFCSSLVCQSTPKSSFIYTFSFLLARSAPATTRLTGCSVRPSSSTGATWPSGTSTWVIKRDRSMRSSSICKSPFFISVRHESIVYLQKTSPVQYVLMLAVRKENFFFSCLARLGFLSSPFLFVCTNEVEIYTMVCTHSSGWTRLDR